MVQNHLIVMPRAPTTTGTTPVVVPRLLPISISRSLYFVIFQFVFILTHCESSGTKIFIIRQLKESSTLVLPVCWWLHFAGRDRSTSLARSIPSTYVACNVVLPFFIFLWVLAQSTLPRCDWYALRLCYKVCIHLLWAALEYVSTNVWY